MNTFEKTIGRVTIQVSSDGAIQHDYGHGCTLLCLGGWNSSCEVQRNLMSVEELRDLRYLLDRAITFADEAKESRR